MDAMTFWKRYGKGQYLLEVLEKAGTTYGYFKLIANRRKRPGVDLARRLVEASGGEMTLDALLPPTSEMRLGKAPATA